MRRRPGLLGPAAAHAAVALALWPVPLLGMVHAEGAAVVAFASWFIAGIASVGAFEREEGRGAVVRRHLALLVIPWTLLTVTVFWRPNCGYLLGLGLFAAMVPPSTLLGVAVADVLVSYQAKAPRRWLVACGLLLAAVPSALVLKFNPQLFVYNPVFGGVLGPIYDAELAIRPGFFAHQMAAVVAAAGVMAVARWRRTKERSPLIVSIALCSVIAVVTISNDRLGITQSERNIQRVLSARADGEGVVLHYRPGSIPVARARALVTAAEFRLWQIDRALGIAPTEAVQIYLYPDPETKGALIGSRETSVVPVWLTSPQVHLLNSRIDGDLGHELVHVVAREVGGTITGATWKIGLVEGIAVALEPPDGRPTPEAQVVAALSLESGRGGLADAAEAVTGAMDPLGFWTGRAAVSYSTAGAFTGWLLQEYGPDPLLAVYGGTSWRDAYGVRLDSLATAWSRHLGTREVTPEAEAFTAWRFGVPSLFEVRCPHHVPRWRRLFREADQQWRDGAASVPTFTQAGLATDDSLSRAVVYSRLALVQALEGQADDSARTLARRMLRADTARAMLSARLEVAYAEALAGDTTGYAEVLEALPPYAVQTGALIRLAAKLPPDDLRRYLRPAPDTTEAARLGAALAEGTPPARFLAGFRWTEAGRPDRAWQSVASALDSLTVPLDDRSTVDLLAARLASLAGDLPAADSLAASAARGYMASGRSDPARLAFDLRERLVWLRASREAADG
ncbi:MAG: hypothetical protein AAF791_01090 [Bacteroidota bacterium]